MALMSSFPQVIVVLLICGSRLRIFPFSPNIDFNSAQHDDSSPRCLRPFQYWRSLRTFSPPDLSRRVSRCLSGRPPSACSSNCRLSLWDQGLESSRVLPDDNVIDMHIFDSRAVSIDVFGEVDRDLVQPGLEARPTLRRAEAGEGFDEGFLKEVRGVIVAAYHAVEERVERLLVFFYQFIECFRSPASVLLIRSRSSSIYTPCADY
jgi:hypothetical protein